MAPPVLAWIWHVKGSVPLPPAQSDDEAFERLDPLFGQAGTRRERAGDTLVFTKKDQAAQDRMAIFDGGTLRIERGAAGPVLRYRLVSRALLFCFLAPFLFLAIAGATIGLGRLGRPHVETPAEKAKEAAEARKPPPPMNPIDKALGAPAPEKPGKKKEEGDGERDKKPSPTPAYVFAGIFAFLYVAGRILEDRLVRTLFRKRLSGA